MQSSITTPRGCFLGVERSLTGKRWEERLGDARQALALSQQLDLRAGSTSCVLRDARWRGLLRMRTFLCAIRRIASS
jgi:hypothetical protein